jgi:hypothetical protein
MQAFAEQVQQVVHSTHNLSLRLCLSFSLSISLHPTFPHNLTAATAATEASDSREEDEDVVAAAAAASATVAATSKVTYLRTALRQMGRDAEKQYGDVQLHVDRHCGGGVGLKYIGPKHHKHASQVRHHVCNIRTNTFHIHRNST